MLPTPQFFPADLNHDPSIVRLPFTKMHGLGNDFVMLKRSDIDPAWSLETLAALVCDRHFGVGADGLIVDAPPTKEHAPDGSPYDVRFVYLNSDGSWAEMCGNGIRCFARFVRDQQRVHTNVFLAETLAGPIRPQINDDQSVTVDMGLPIFEAARIPFQPVQSSGLSGQAAQPEQFVKRYPLSVLGRDVPVTLVSMGNPHCLIFTEDLPNAGNSDACLDPAVFGPAIETHPAFPKKTNVEFLEVIDRHTLRCTVWERGCGFTLACGTGACASAVAGILLGKVESPVTVELPGGSLRIDWREGQSVMMTGPATYAFEGVIPLPLAQLSQPPVAARSR